MSIAEFKSPVTSRRSRSLATAALVAVALALSASHTKAAGSDPANLGGQLSGTDAFRKISATKTASGRVKKRVISRGKDQVAPVVSFESNGTAGQGSLRIAAYESFQVTGTWTLGAKNRVTLAVDADAFAANKGPELCPASSCTPTATWTARTAVYNPKTQILKAKWLVTVRQTSADGSYVEETFAFKGKGKLSPLA